MIPLRDTIPTRITPHVNHALIFTHVIVFAAQIITGQNAEQYIRALGFTPARFFHPFSFGDGVLEVAITLVSSLFIHGGWLHLGGNLLYLWIFGDNVEGVAVGLWARAGRGQADAPDQFPSAP